MNNNTTLSEFLQQYHVEIPMLQRDYAQGRKSQEKIAKEFLEAIFNVLDNKKKFLHIDFIYGYEENSKFLLIDGQQRITTLWLLYLYLYKRLGKLAEIQEYISKFSYKTRRSSADFCKNLIKKDFDMSAKPSQAIREKGGAFAKEEDLDSDPTIKAMLHMLDLIYIKVGNASQEKLNRLTNNLGRITFYLFDMKNVLGEDLYIKMNARGKQLSQYENLKALIEKNKDIATDATILADIDTNWSDYFFSSGDIENFDTKGRNFLHYGALFFYLSSGKKENLQNLIDDPARTIDDKMYDILQDIENIKILNETITLVLTFDESKLSEGLKIKDSNFFKEKLSFKDLCYFYAILSYIKNIEEMKTEELEYFNDYLRVCKHFIENHRLDKAEEAMPSFVELFKKLAQDTKISVYDILLKNPTNTFHQRIYKLEVRKSKLILQSRNSSAERDWEEIFNKTSENNFLVGWVDFLLDFSDDDFQHNQHNSSSKYEKPNIKKFTDYANLTMEIFDWIKDKDNLTLFQRAFLCFGHFAFYSTNYFYGNRPNDNFRDREAWHWLLSGERNDEKLPYFKNFLDALLEISCDNSNEKMNIIIDTTDLSKKDWWDQLLIMEGKLFGFLNEKNDVFQKYRRIRFLPVDNPTKVELLPGLRNTKNVKDLLDYGFYQYCCHKGLDLSEYESEKEQYGDKFPIESHFSINNIEVVCNSVNSIISIGSNKININLKNNIFEEFERVLMESGLL